MIQSTNSILIVGSLISLAIVVALYTVLIRLCRRAKGLTGGPEEFQSSRASLENLEPDDISFLVKHPALTRTVVRALRSERRKILREYLRSLRWDFNRTCAAIRVVMVESLEDRSDLAREIFKQQVRFRVGLAQAECSMMLEVLGLAVVDFDSIIDALGSIRLNVIRLLPTSSQNPAACSQ